MLAAWSKHWNYSLRKLIFKRKLKETLLKNGSAEKNNCK